MEVHFMLRCPVCGCEINPIYLKTYAEKQTVIINGDEVTQFKCDDCDTFITPIKLKFDIQYYHDKSQELYGTPWKDALVILDEIKEYGLFDNEKYEASQNEQSARCMAYIQKERQIEKDKNKPKCPTCNSTNIQKISTTSKVIGASLFGLLSKNATSQFKCNNCGYKW